MKWVHFRTVVEVYGDEIEQEFSYPEDKWTAMSERQRLNFLDGESQQLRDHMNVYTELLED